MDRENTPGSCCGGCCGAGVADVPKPAAGGIRTTLRVGGMCCANEVKALESVLRPMPGVREWQINLMAGKVTVFHTGAVTAEALIRAIAPTGMKALPDGETSPLEDGKRERLVAVGISGLFAGLGLLLQWRHAGPALAADAAFAVAIVAGWWFVLPKAWHALRRRTPDMNVLMAAAVIGALGIHEWSEGAAVSFLFALSELLEAYSMDRAKNAVRALMKLTPETAWLKEGSGFREVPVAEVGIGARIAVQSGARIPLDGIVESGASAVDQAPITGESMPVEKGPGEPVFAGTVNGAGSLEIRTTASHAETAIAKILRMVEEAQSQKAPSQRFVDRFARYYTPSVMAAALLVILLPPLLSGAPWQAWFYKGLVMLVVACPCALVISTPVSIVSGLTALARRGVLIKGGAVLEAVGKLTALAVDKTGTITEGAPKVTRVIPVHSQSEEEILRVAAAIDIHSSHPLSRAVVRHALEKNVRFPRGENYQSRPGRGAEAMIDGRPCFVGNHRYAHEIAVCSPEIDRRLAGIETEEQSLVLVGHRPHANRRGEVLGILVVNDAIRENAPAAISSLHRLGIRKIVMLSGDNRRTTAAIAKKVGIDEAWGDLLPEQKIEKIRALLAKTRHVGMIGDGVNDAPAMAAASVGIAMGAGTDAALETADMALVQNDLGKIAEAVHAGRRAVRVIRFNIAFALALKAAFILLALTGNATLWLAVAADMGATLLVIANALRLLRVA